MIDFILLTPTLSNKRGLKSTVLGIDVGQIVKRKLMATQQTQIELWEKSGVNQGPISHIELG